MSADCAFTEVKISGIFLRERMLVFCITSAESSQTKLNPAVVPQTRSVNSPISAQQTRVLAKYFSNATPRIIIPAPKVIQFCFWKDSIQ